MNIREILDNAQRNFYNSLKQRKLNKIYQKIGEYIYELYKSGESIEDEKLIELLKKADELNKDEK
ncbi:MAG: hypothetical protein ABIL49_01795 [candidate division WOR-3 bacterium]|jgi:hypothetical protein